MVLSFMDRGYDSVRPSLLVYTIQQVSERTLHWTVARPRNYTIQLRNNFRSNKTAFLQLQLPLCAIVSHSDEYPQ
jgi:hypothetical protein